MSAIDLNEIMYDPIEREEALEERIREYQKQQKQPTYTVYFMNEIKDIPVIIVPIQLPMYRLENGRTITLQDEFLAKNPDKPDDFFERDKNSPEAQLEQHELLMRLKEIKDIYKYFQNKKNVQTEPLIITNDGFVVNGNRRLSSWRTLYFENRKDYKHFEYIKVALLPVADEKAIDKLEADLQIAPDIKADFYWHAEAKMMQKQYEKMRNYESVANLYSITPADVEVKVQALEYAREYLKRNNKDRQWSELDKFFYVFEAFVKQRKRLDDSTDKSLLESIIYSYITKAKSENDVEGRLYEKVPDIRKHLDAIVGAVIDAIAENIDEEEIAIVSDDSSLLLNDPEEVEESKVKIAQMLANSSTEVQKKVVEISEEVIEDEKAKEREKKSSNYLIDQVKKAEKALTNAVGSTDSSEPSKEIDGLLEAIEKNVKVLREWLVKQ